MNRTYILASLLLFSLSTSGFVIATNALDIEDPEREEEHQAVMQLLSSQIDEAEQERINRNVRQLTDANLTRMHECFDVVYSDLEASEISNLRKYVQRTTSLIRFHWAIKGWLLGGSYTLGGVGFVVLGTASFNFFDNQTQSALTTASAAILLGAGFLRYLGYQSKKAFLIMSRDMQEERERVGMKLAATRDEMQRRNIGFTVVAASNSPIHSQPVAESDEDVNAPPITPLPDDKGKGEEIVLDMEEVEDPHTPEQSLLLGEDQADSAPDPLNYKKNV